MDKKQPTSQAELVTHDFSLDRTPPVPDSLTAIGKVVHWEGTPNFNKVSVVLDPAHEVKPGQFLGVWHKKAQDTLTIIQVSNCFEVNPNEDPKLAVARERLGLAVGYAGEGVSTRIFRLASCETVEEFDVEEIKGKWQVKGAHAPESLARAGDVIVLLPSEIGPDVIGGEREASSGLHLGQTYGPQPVEVTLKPTLFQLHTGVFGNPGKGKSYFSGILIEEAYSWDIPTLVLDVNGETSDAAKHLGGKIITLPDKSSFGLSLELITPRELVSITPNVQPGTQYAELIESAHDQLRNEARSKNGPVTFNALKARIEQIGDAAALRAPSIMAATSRLSVLERNPLIGENFDFIGTLKKHKLVVLDCRFLSLSQTRLIAAAAARQLQKHGKEMAKLAHEKGDKEAAKWFSLLFVDEAHAIVPNNEDVVSTQVLYELARMGRHVRTGLILSSQSPSDLDSSVLKRLQTRFIFAIEKDQLRSIGGVVADLNEEILAQLPKLPRGICAVSGTSEIVRHGFLLKVKTRTTPVGGSTPQVFQGRKKKDIGGKK